MNEPLERLPGRAMIFSAIAWLRKTPPGLSARCPAATNVQQSLPRTQSQFAADVIKFLFLRNVEIIASRFEVRARINQAAIQPELIEIVGYIVVKRYHAPVTLWRVTLATNSR